MKKLLKRAILGVASRFGLFSLVLESPWRQRRLLILCYHGISLEDEHQWEPSLYVAPDRLADHFDLLRRLRCSVLPLGEALERLQAGTLPPRSVTLTFDDGFYDFYRNAAPLLKAAGFPATLYLTTYYCDHDLAVFDPMVSYLLWKGQDRTLEWPGLLGSGSLATLQDRQLADRGLKQHAHSLGFSAQAKEEMVIELADRLGLDYDDIRRKRILRLMRPEEVKEVGDYGVDVQLHTHRHRVSQDRSLFEREIHENRQRITAYTGRHDLQHFCYPGGYHLPPFGQWLRAQQVVSATTCQPGLATASTDPMGLPRFVPTCTTTKDDMLSWVSGFAALLPVAQTAFSVGQLLEGPPI